MEELVKAMDRIRELEAENADLKQQLSGMAAGRCAKCHNQKQRIADVLCSKCQEAARWPVD